MKKEISQLTIGALILVVFIVLVTIYYTISKTPTTTTTTVPVATTISQSLTDCSDKPGSGCLSKDDCAEGVSLQECCNNACKFLNMRGFCETGYRECAADTCCCTCR
ncbi:MAG: hypothetical protein QMD36_06080 [Candidatus Aenigmarchaeota archaeon]|nr:hypothetical protein [Candidatus Aenigmarchaeota archaeon]